MNSRHIPSEGRDLLSSPFRGEQDTQQLVVRRFSALKPDRTAGACEKRGYEQLMPSHGAQPTQARGQRSFSEGVKEGSPPSTTPAEVATLCAVCSAAQSCDPENSSPPGPSVHGILQARILKWIAMPSPRVSSQPRDRTYVSCTAGGFFTAEPPGPLCTACRTLTQTGSVSGAPPVCQGLGPQTGNLLQELSP